MATKHTDEEQDLLDEMLDDLRIQIEIQHEDCANTSKKALATPTFGEVRKVYILLL